MWRATRGATWRAMNGPKVTAPHRPTTTLGMPARNSRKPPTRPARRLGSRSTMTSAVPIATGTPMTSAIADVPSVPMIAGSAPYLAPAGTSTPARRTGWPYRSPSAQVVPVKKPTPLYLIAGHALTMRTSRMKPSARTGTAAPAAPAQRMWVPSRIPARSRARARRGSGPAPAPPPGRSARAGDAIGSGADLGDLRVGEPDHAGRQRLEVHLVEVGRGALAGVHRPVQERADVLGHRAVGLLGVHDRVLVVDDRVPVRGRAVDHRDRLVGGRLGDEARRARGDRGRDRQHEPAGSVLDLRLAQPGGPRLGAVADADVGHAAGGRRAALHHAAVALLAQRPRHGREADRGPDVRRRPAGRVLRAQVGG